MYFSIHIWLLDLCFRYLDGAEFHTVMYKSSDVLHPAPARCASQQLHLKGKVLSPWTEPSPRRHPASLYEPLGTPKTPSKGSYIEDVNNLHNSFLNLIPTNHKLKEDSSLPLVSASSSSINFPPKEGLDKAFLGLNPKHKAVSIDSKTYTSDNSAKENSIFGMNSPLKVSNFYTAKSHFVQKTSEESRDNLTGNASSSHKHFINHPRNYNTPSKTNDEPVDFELYYEQTQDHLKPSKNTYYGENYQSNFTVRGNRRKRR